MLNQQQFDLAVKFFKMNIKKYSKDPNGYDSLGEAYKTIGGAAHLDQNYTVFGEVIKGLEIIDSIASVQTNESDRPLKDVRIITARLIERKDN